MDINRDNYEAYLLDLMEGRLSAAESGQVRDFLLLNPDCAEGWDEGEPWMLDAGVVHHPQKEQLKKDWPRILSTPDESNFDVFSIARMEGDLTPQQEAKHDLLLAGDDEKRQEWGVWQMTRLTGGKTEFKGKDQLKRHKRNNIRVIWIGIGSVAAAVTIWFALVRTGPLTELPVPAETAEVLEPIVNAEEEMIAVAEPSVSEDANLALEVVPRLHEEVDPGSGTKNRGVVRERREPAGKTSLPAQKQLPEPDVTSRPLRLAAADRRPVGVADRGAYDRIVPLDLPVGSGATFAFSETRVEDRSLRETVRAYSRERDISLLSIASSGVEGINRITGSEMALNVAKDDQGDVSGFRFRSGWLSVTAPVDKAE